MIVGAGLAGAAAARALTAHGLACDVVDRRPLPPPEAAGTLGGLYHGVVHRDDGAHARWLRAASLQASRVYAPAVAAGHVPGHASGLLRGQTDKPHDAMRTLLDALALPPDWIEAWSAEQIVARTGLPARHPAWHYPTGGWVSPLALRRHWLGADGIEHRVADVDRLQRTADGRWRLLDAAGAALAESEIVVLANASDAVRLLGAAPGPWQRTRGQVSVWRGEHPPLPLPLADGGYALQLDAGALLFGSTSQRDDDDAAVRDADHAHNLSVLHRLTGWNPPAGALHRLEGRVGWRMQSADRLPWIGPLPCIDAPSGRADVPRLVAREPGLYVLAALGSRGLTHAPLAGELLASWITGAPWPVPASLVDALDVARFAARAQRLSRS